MIQRVQTIYLAIAAILLAVAFFFPVMSFIDDGQVWLEVYLKGFQDNSAPSLGLNKLILLPLLLLNVVAIIFAGVAIFLYKNRNLQMRLVRMGIVLVLVIVALIFFYYGNILGTATATTPDFNHMGIYLILGALILFILANRSIQKDEKLVRSADRLR